MYVAKERLLLDAEGRVVKEGDPKARRLLIGKGQEMSDDDARMYGLLDTPKPKPEDKPTSPKLKDTALPLSEVKPAEKVKETKGK